ncbi:MAG: metallophosphoesterase family protein [Planctomycetes bacterium]|nr:metallophosphoesterase family protein [Planctomycetota bacterium]
MKILVLADIHANWPALQAIDESFDACFFLGDLVDYGSNPAPCVDWVQRHATAAVRGNHDHAVAQRIVARGTTGLRRLAAATRPLQWNALNAQHLKFLSRLPVMLNLELDGLRFALVHATPRDPMDEYLTVDPAGWQQRLQGIEADFVLVGHTHVPFCVDVGPMKVVNPGSVGQPRDGDPRCAYAVIENGQIHFHRVAYDIDATLKHLRESGVVGEVLEIAEATLRSGGLVPARFMRERLENQPTE